MYMYFDKAEKMSLLGIYILGIRYQKPCLKQVLRAKKLRKLKEINLNNKSEAQKQTR